MELLSTLDNVVISLACMFNLQVAGDSTNHFGSTHAVCKSLFDIPALEIVEVAEAELMQEYHLINILNGHIGTGVLNSSHL